MKKIWILIVFAFLFVACSSNQSGTKENSDSTAVNEESGKPANQNAETKGGGSEISKPIMLSEDGFRTKVFDFRTKEQWKYLGDKPCIVDFYADWCMPCRSIAPILHEIAEEYAGKIYVYKVNTDYAQQLCTRYKINGIPALMFCPMKGDYRMSVGANSKEYYESQVETILMVKN